MKVLVAYATRHGATRGIAQCIADTLERNGLAATLAPADQAGGVEDYDAVVIGSAAYAGGWLSQASDFVRRHEASLTNRPVWFFSSGPIGTELIDAKGRDVVKASEPREFAQFGEEIHPRGMQVFFGAFDPDAKPIGLLEKLGAPFMRLPSIRKEMPAGDFRDWHTIEAWAESIAAELREEAAVPA
jgi:menaquinone-dependent protoporphyrinogen oxidase